MIEIDDISNLVTVVSECTLREIEDTLQDRHFTLGYFVPPKNDLTVEEALARNYRNLYGSLYGELSDLCVALQLHSKNEKNLSTFLAPRQAAGPDWKNFVLGSERSLGFIYRATLKFFPKPTHFLYLAIGLAHDIASYPLERELIRSELTPWLYGRFGHMQLPRGFRLARSPLILLTAWAGSRDWVDACRREIERKLEERYVWRWIEGKNLQRNAQKILHEKYPLKNWGGFSSFQEREERTALEKEIMEVLE